RESRARLGCGHAIPRPAAANPVHRRFANPCALSSPTQDEAPTAPRRLPVHWRIFVAGKSRQPARASGNRGRERRSAEGRRKIGMGGLARVATGGHLDQAPGRLVGEQSLEGDYVEPMAPAEGAIATKNRRGRQSQIAQGIECLVADELVREAKSLWIDDA